MRTETEHRRCWWCGTHVPGPVVLGRAQCADGTVCMARESAAVRALPDVDSVEVQPSTTGVRPCD